MEFIKPQTFQTVVQNFKQVADDIVDITLDLFDPQEITFLAGQFIAVSKRDERNMKITRAYTITSPPYEKNTVRLMVKVVPGGHISPYLGELKKGEKVEFDAPFGIFVLKKESTRIPVFIGTGVGIAPYFSMLYQMAKDGFDKECVLLWGDRYIKNIYCQEELEKMKELIPQFHYHISISKPEHENHEYDTGRVQQLMKKYLEGTNHEYYLCGNEAMIKDVKKMLLEKGAVKDAIHNEKFW